jgi:integrase
VDAAVSPPRRRQSHPLVTRGGGAGRIPAPYFSLDNFCGFDTLILEVAMKSLTVDELGRLIKVARQHSERDAQLIITTYCHGLRASEAINLGPQNLVAGSLYVERLKGSNDTTQTLKAPERNFLNLNLPVGQPFKMHRTTFWRKMQKYCKLAEIDPHKAHPHSLKHTTGRLAYEAGVGIPEVQKILGHVSGANTLKYMEPTEEQADAVFTEKLALPL